MLDEDEREGPPWAWHVTEILDDNRAPLLVTLLVVAIAVAIVGLAARFAGGVCDPTLVPLEATGQVLAAGLVGTFGAGVGCGALLGTT